ncbi:hypothetical protein Tco_1407934 [Tanacetum coccineum]
MTHIQEVTLDAADNSGPIVDVEPLQKVQNNDDNCNVFNNNREHPIQPESVNDTYLEEQGDTNITIEPLDMSNNGETVDQDDDIAKERDLLASLIEKLKYLNKFQAELDRYHDVNYASKVEIDYAKAKGDLMSYKMESHKCVKEEMVADLSYFNSLENDVDSLKSQMETQKTQFLNEIDRLFREYYYADHMNVILGVYTTLDEFNDLQCDYVEQVVKCERLENELSKRNTTSKSFEALQKHAINLELALQKSREQLNNC